MCLLGHIAPSDIRNRLVTSNVTQALQKTREAASKELKRILEDQKRHPMTYRHCFKDTWQNIQQNRFQAHVKESVSAATVTITVYEKAASGTVAKNKEYIRPIVFNKKLDTTFKHNMDKYFAGQALDALNANYKLSQVLSVLSRASLLRHWISIVFQNSPANHFFQSERKYFMDVVAKQVIERHLVAALSETFSPIALARYSDQEIRDLASEQLKVI